jgi:multiple sugar transport system substrate-binding protein
MKLPHFTLLLAILLVFAGCSGGEKPAAQGTENGSDKTVPKKEVSAEPITLKVLQYLSKISDEEFKSLIADPVKQKYPNITMEVVNYQNGQNLGDLIAAGDFPDIIFSGILDINDFRNYKVLEDLSPMIKEDKLDLNKFEPAAVQMIRSYDESGRIYALPFSMGFSALFYNKDLFDKFAVPYPKDGMTWEETTELAKSMTRSDGGVSYAGLGLMAAYRFAIGNFQDSFDEKSGKAVFTTDGWKKTLKIYSDIAMIPGNDNATKNDFLKGTVAMRADLNPLLDNLGQMTKKGGGFNWDIASFPSPSWKRGVVDTPLQKLMISSTSKHKQEAFKVLDLMSGKDVQEKLSRQGRPSSLNDPQMKTIFGQDLGYLKGKNLQALFKNRHEPQPLKSVYDSILNDQYKAAVEKVTSNSADINTALRDAEEEANKEIAAQNQ